MDISQKRNWMKIVRATFFCEIQKTQKSPPFVDYLRSYLYFHDLSLYVVSTSMLMACPHVDTWLYTE